MVATAKTAGKKTSVKKSSMENEMKQLEENTKNERMKQRSEDLQGFFDLLIEEWGAAYKLELRAVKLMLITMGINLLVITWCVFFFADIEAVETPLDYFGILIWLVLLRVYWFMGKRMYKEGKLDGALDTFRKLGMLEEEDAGNIKNHLKRESPFKRFKEFFERVGKKVNKEAYA